jgi:hypothetical protein
MMGWIVVNFSMSGHFFRRIGPGLTLRKLGEQAGTLTNCRVEDVL